MDINNSLLLKEKNIREYMRQKCGCIFLLAFAVLFMILLGQIIPEGCLYGSTIDWYSQHVTLAETIRSAILEEKTLAPAWLPLGGGSNGYQFAYYGYFRPDILIGCLLPGIPMKIILPVYVLTGYLASVFLLYRWLRTEGTEQFFSFMGGALFLTANCFFQTHRQIMFVNYMPFLLLALLLLRKKKYAWVSICLFLVYLHSFYYAIACLAVVIWYWYSLEGKGFFRRCLVTVSLSIGMAMMLLLPSFLVILEHKHSGGRAATAADLFLPELQNLLYSPYGMGLTVISLYLLLAGLGYKKYRRTSLIFLCLILFGAASWLLNGTLYARAKILIPFVPLLMRHNISVFQAMYRGKIRWQLWPFVLFVPAVISQWNKQWFIWIAIDIGILFGVVILSNMVQSGKCRSGRTRAGFLFLLVMPTLIYLRIAQEESWVEEPKQTAFAESEQKQICENPLYRFDSILDSLNEGNTLNFAEQQKTTMYSSVTNAAYQDFYYNVLATPIQINNRTALLAEENPFLQNLMGVRYLETTVDKIPAGYEIIKQKGDAVIAENPHVLPIAYTTSDCMSMQQFETLDTCGKLEALAKYSIVWEEEGLTYWTEEGKDVSDLVWNIQEAELPDSVQMEEVEDGYHLSVSKNSLVKLRLREPVTDMLFLQFQVKNRTGAAVVISANGIKNKLSGSTAPYPNENFCFSYLLSENEEIHEIAFQLSKGNYEITDIRMTAYPTDIFAEKRTKPVTLVTETKQEKSTVLSCRAELSEDGYFVTSIPKQRGLHLYVDGEETKIETVNLAFAGARLSEGVHEVELKFIPPGQRCGYAISLLSAVLFLIRCILARRCKDASVSLLGDRK